MKVRIAILICTLACLENASPASVTSITVEESRNVWIDHCTFYNCADGALDITHGSDLVTVSWCKFFYTFNSGHNFVSLVGHSDDSAAEDAGRLRITYPHNWWSTLCVERMPRVRFGRVHVFNNYFNSPGNNYCVRASIESEVLVEQNYFEDIDEPYVKFDPPGLINALDNLTVNCTGVESYNDSVFTPLSICTPDAAASVPGAVTNPAGAGMTGFQVGTAAAPVGWRAQFSSPFAETGRCGRSSRG